MKANSADDGLGGAHIQTFSQSKESSEVIWRGLIQAWPENLEKIRCYPTDRGDRD
jgi:hypothetical protein